MLSLATLVSLSYFSYFIISYFQLRFSPAILSILILFAYFSLIHKGIPGFLKSTSDFLMKHMGLFLIPSVLMVLAYQAFFIEHSLSLFLVVFLSTVLSLALVLWVTYKILNGFNDRDE